MGVSASVSAKVVVMAQLAVEVLGRFHGRDPDRLRVTFRTQGWREIAGARQIVWRHVQKLSAERGCGIGRGRKIRAAAAFPAAIRPSRSRQTPKPDSRRNGSSHRASAIPPVRPAVAAVDRPVQADAAPGLALAERLLHAAVADRGRVTARSRARAGREAAVSGPIRFGNSSEPSEKRPSRSVCQMKRSGWRASSSVHRFGVQSGACPACSARERLNWVTAVPSRARTRFRSCSARVRRALRHGHGCSRLRRTRRTGRTRPALRSTGAGCSSAASRRGRARGRSASSLAQRGPRRRGRRGSATAFARGRGVAATMSMPWLPIGKIKPRTAAGHEHAGRRAEAAQPLHPDRAVRTEPACEPRHLAPVRIGGTEILFRKRAARPRRTLARRPHWPTESACRRPTTAMRAGRSPHAPPGADRSHLQLANSVRSSTWSRSRWLLVSPAPDGSRN